MSHSHAASIAARIDRLPATASIWTLVMFLSVGGFFEIYDLFQMTYLPPGLIRDGIFHAGSHGVLGMSDQGALGAATFAGLFVGEMFVSRLADRIGRRALFTGALLLYTAASLAMCVQTHALGILVCRFAAGCGIGAELITIGAFLTELVPKAVRGRAFALCFAIGYLAMPVLALVSWLWVPHDPLGVSGWRWVVLLGGSGAVVVWWLQSRLPESPRWLASTGREADAEAVLQRLEQAVERESGRPLPAVRMPAVATPAARRAPSMWDARHRGRTAMLIVFNAFLSIGFFGFSQWLPTLLAAQGASVTKSLWYAFVIAFAYPVSPFIAGVLADRIERKWLIVASAFGVALFGTAFAMSAQAPFVIAFGLLVTLSNTVLASNGTAYQSEVFPTEIRGRALGFVHSIGRLTGIASSFIVALLLERAGVSAVFVLIGGSMLIVMVSIGVFGPYTNNRALDEITGRSDDGAENAAAVRGLAALPTRRVDGRHKGAGDGAV
ncbi:MULTISPECIES: MFS transporter [unclassified Burkholderia]|uniref:MFS transporter n=1 Tax=unclassified Burkholderia TaxID=2613784 RepID=UPI000F582511|nr:MULTISPECIES: MFS transporter [unclassified Burkholderia]RQR46749.1 MFS transporter [Burkholderia sp. Bp9131]RQR79635.1 MFS transporter [Burkholderia sp. Bp9015]